MVRFVWSILDSRPGGKLGGCLAEVIWCYLPIPAHFYTGTTGMPRSQRPILACPICMQRISLQPKLMDKLIICGCAGNDDVEWAPFQFSKLGQAALQPYLNKTRQRWEMPKRIYLCQTKSCVYDSSSFRVQFNPVTYCSHHLGFTNSCLEYF